MDVYVSEKEIAKFLYYLKQNEKSRKALVIVPFIFRRILHYIDGLLSRYIWTNPTYDREYEWTLKLIGSLISIAEDLIREFMEDIVIPELMSIYEASGIRLIHVVHNTMSYYLSHIKDAYNDLKEWLNATREAIDYALTKGERRLLNREFLDHLFKKTIRGEKTLYVYWRDDNFEKKEYLCEFYIVLPDEPFHRYAEYVDKALKKLAEFVEKRTGKDPIQYVEELEAQKKQKEAEEEEKTSEKSEKKEESTKKAEEEKQKEKGDEVKKK